MAPASCGPSSCGRLPPRGRPPHPARPLRRLPPARLPLLPRSLRPRRRQGPGPAGLANRQAQRPRPATQSPPCGVGRARAVRPAGRTPKVATGRGCLVGNPGAAVAAPGDPRGPPGEPWQGSPGTSRSPRVAFRHPRSATFDLDRTLASRSAPFAGASRSNLEPLKAGNGSLPLLALHRYRSFQASWTFGHPSRPSRRRSPTP